MKLLLDLQGAQSESRYRGIGRYSRAFARSLIEAAGEHEVHLLLNDELSFSDGLLSEFIEILPQDNIRIFSSLQAVSADKPSNIWRSQAAALIRESVINDIKPDIVHVSSLFEGFVDDAVVSIGDLPSRHLSSVTLYDLVPLRDPLRYLSDPNMESYYNRKVSHLRRSDLLLSISEYSKHEAVDLLGLDPTKIAVIFAGVDSVFRPGAVAGVDEAILRHRLSIPGGFILHVGALDARKNAIALIEAFSLMPPDYKKEKVLVFAGRLSEHEEALVRLACGRYGLSQSQTIFSGYVSEPDLISLYRLCDVVVFPSLHEGFGLPALEAMACGSPVFVSDSTSLPEVVGRRDVLFDPNRPEMLADRLLTLHNDPAYRTELTRWGPDRARSFTWAECARKAWDALSNAVEIKDSKCGASLKTRRPKLAFVSPLPPDRTGIATYSSELLPELAQFYDIECIIHDTVVSDKWVQANARSRSIEWFERNAPSYDRILYSMGNSSFHAHMFALMQKHPGVVILHDVYLGNLIEWMCGQGLMPWENFERETYRSHGLSGLQTLRNEGIHGAVEKLQLNGGVFRNSLGVIVHSRHAAELATVTIGDAAAKMLAVVPQLRATLKSNSKKDARKRLAIDTSVFTVCSFGLVTSNKLGQIIYDAWCLAGLDKDRKYRLIFVGGINDEYGQALATKANGQSANVTFTGYVSQEQYELYIQASDAAIQLRRNSRGETSRAILDCMAGGIPVIANAHGASAELEADNCIMIDEASPIEGVIEAILWVLGNAIEAEAIGDRARRFVAEHHKPSLVAKIISDHVEEFYSNGRFAQERDLFPAIADLTDISGPSMADRLSVSRSVAANERRVSKPQILFDVSIYAEQDANTGIQRVVRSILDAYLRDPPNGFRIEPVIISGDRPLYARDFITNRLGLPNGNAANDDVEFSKGDIYLQVDWVPDRLPQLERWVERFKRGGGTVTIVVYDLLPLILPRFFPDFMHMLTWRWFKAALSYADKLACISQATANDVARFAYAVDSGYDKAKIACFNLGSELNSSAPLSKSEEARELISSISSSTMFLMVGTVEPRKGHLQVLEAFSLLWQSGYSVSLVIIGKAGWMTDDVLAAIHRNEEFGNRLFWFDRVPDDQLGSFYLKSDGLIAASFGEGFGLPLVEAAKYNIPIIARGIEVFREVCGEGAFYFEGSEPDGLATALKQWLLMLENGSVPLPAAIQSISWSECANQLARVAIG